MMQAKISQAKAPVRFPIGAAPWLCKQRPIQRKVPVLVIDLFGHEQTHPLIWPATIKER